MKNLMIAGLFAFVLATAPGARAEEIPGFSEHRLYEACASNDEALHALCVAYLRGLIFGLQFGQKLEFEGRPICVVPDPEAARLVVDNFIANRPKTLEDDKDGAGDLVALSALLGAYRCKPPKS